MEEKSLKPAVAKDDPESAAERLLAESKLARVRRTEEKIRAALNDERCDFAIGIVAAVGEDGLTRHQAQMRVVPL